MVIQFARRDFPKLQINHVVCFSSSMRLYDWIV